MRVLGSNLNGWPEYTSSFHQQDIVLKAELANNVDRPESTLDALMQAIVCKARLGWRPDSRKIVVIATDQGFHSALMVNSSGCSLPMTVIVTWMLKAGTPAQKC